MKKFLKIGSIIVLLCLVIFVVAVAAINIYYKKTLNAFIVSPEKIASLEPRPTALILGAGLQKDLTPSDVLTDRLEIGYQLLKDHKVNKLILSGDNRIESHNEPDAMKKYLLAKGVDEKSLVLDYAGRRTYDSCYRANKIFGQTKIYVVTQDFHIIRAVYLCRELGIDTIGVTSDIKKYQNTWMNYVRDYLGLSYAVFDINVFKPLPVLGDKIEVE